jgi:hypothetical protein
MIDSYFAVLKCNRGAKPNDQPTLERRELLLACAGMFVGRATRMTLFRHLGRQTPLIPFQFGGFHNPAWRSARLGFGRSTASLAKMTKDVTSHRMGHALRRAWGRVRWRIAAIVAFTGTSTILIVCLAVAALNVVVRRESANVMEKQIQCWFRRAGPLLPQFWIMPALARRHQRIPSGSSHYWRTLTRHFPKLRLP